jgi:cytidylate kinase
MCRGICGVVRRFLQNNFYRAVAILVVNCFIVSFVLEQGVTALLDEQRETGQVAKELINDLCIPGAVGRVTEARYFGSPQTVIVIQDLHCHPEVQRNIAKMLSSLERKYVFKAVYLEGAAGPVDTSWLSCIRDEKVRNGLVESLVDQGKLTGAEYYSVKAGKPFIIQGMEDKELHTGNLKRLGKILEDKDGIEADLQAVEGAVQQLKRNYYNKKQTKLDELVSDHRNGKLETRRYYAFLKKYSDTLGVDIYGYRDIAVYLSLVEQEKKLDYRKIAVEMQRFIALFRQRLPYNEYAKLLESTRDRQNMDQMYRTIERFADACHLKGTLVAQFPALARFFDYLALSREINPVLLLKEENRLVRDLEMKLADNESEKDIAFAVDYCRNLREYYTNKIAADDYGYFSENARRFAALWTIYSDNGALARLNARKALFDEFYRVNLERNHCFINNILGVKRIEPSSGNAIVSIQENIEKLLAGLGSNDIKVVVSGGFHTDGISELLAKAGISYLVLTPNVTQDTSFASEVYAKLAAEQSRILSQTLALQALSQQPNSDKAKAAAEAILAAYAELSKEMSKAEIVQSIQALYADLKAKDEKANKIIVPVSFTLEETNGIPSVKIRYGDKEEEYLSREGEIVDSVSGNDEKNNDSKAKKSLKEQMKKAFSIVVATIGFNLLLIRSANAQTFDFSYIQNINPLILLIGGVIVFGIVANLAKGATKIFAKRQVINTLKSNNVMKLLKLSKDNSVEKDAVINALASIGLPAIPVLINNLKGDYYSISYSALKKIGLPAVPSLIAEIEREDSEISFYRIFSILQHINPTDDTTMAAIRQLIAHKDKYIAQMAAKYYISVRGIPEAKIENLELLKELKKSEDVRVDENILRIDAPVVEPLLDALSQNVSREVRVRSIVAAKAAIDTSLAEEKREGAIQIIVDAGLTLVVKNIHITNVLEYGVPSAVQISKGDIELFRKHIKALEVLVDHSNSDDKVSIEDIVKANELKLDMPIVAPLVNALEQKKWVTDVLVTQAIPKSVIAFENYFNEDFREQAMKMVAAMGLNLVNAGILCCSTIEYGVPLAAQASKGDIKQFGENIGHLAGFARYLNSKGDINPFLSLKTVNDIDIINNIRNPEEFESALYIGDGLVEFEHKNTFGEKVIMDNMIAALSSNIATFKGVLGIENSFIVTRESVFKGTRIVSIGLSKHEKDTWEEFSTWCYAELKRIHGYSEEDVISVNYEEVYSGNSCSGATTGYDVQFTVQEENTKQIRILVTDRSDWERLSHLSGKELAKELIKLKDELEKHYPDKYIGDRSVNHSSENIKVALGFTRDELIEVVFKYLTRDTVPVSAVEDIRDMAVGIVELLFKNSLRVHAGGVSMLSSGVVQKELNEEKRLFEEALEESAARHGAELARWGFAQDSGRVKVQVAKGDLIPVGDGLSSLGYASTAIVDGDIVVTVTDGFLRNRSGRAPASIYGELAEHEVRELIYLKANPDKSFHDFHRSAEGRAVSENIFAFAQQSIEEHSLVLSIADISSLVTSSIIGNAQKLDAAKEKEEIDALLGTIREYTAGRNDIIIAVDGTSAAGKGTLAGRLAKDLGFYYLDAGSTNRMITWLALRQGVDIDDGAALHNLVKSNIDRFTIDYSNGRLAIWYAGEGERIDITGAIRSPEVNNAVARVSAHREVLEALFALNRKLVKGKNAIADGRNMGADVFKDTAFSKLYLDAELHARAQKRVEAYQRSGKAADLEEVRKSIKDRDDMDRNRPFYPLRKAEDAEYIDSTDRDAAYKAILEAIVDKIMDERRFGNAFNGGRVMEIAKQLSLFKSSLGSIWQDNTWSGNRAMEPVEYILTMIRQAKEHGFTSIEFSTDDPVGHLDNPAYEARSRELIAAAPRIRKEAEDNGIDIVFHAPSFSFKDSKGVSWFPEPFRDAATYERWLDFSAQIGAKLFTLHISDPHSEESLNGIAGFIEEAEECLVTWTTALGV